MQSRAILIRCGLLAGLMLATASAHGTVTCTVTTVPLSFGTYDPFTAIALDVATTASIRCTTNRGSGERFTVTSALDRGGAPTFNPRQMRNALNNTLNYNLFTTTARTTIFGNGTAGTVTPSVSADIPDKSTPVVITVNIFGRVFAGQDASVGAYSDTLNYMIDF